MRHGESEGNIKHELSGTTDYPLTPVGRLQARVMSVALEESIPLFNEIKTSNLIRTLDTCQLCLGLSRHDVTPHMEGLQINSGQSKCDSEYLEPSWEYQISDSFQVAELLGGISHQTALKFENMLALGAQGIREIEEPPQHENGLPTGNVSLLDDRSFRNK